MFLSFNKSICYSDFWLFGPVMVFIYIYYFIYYLCFNLFARLKI